MNACIYLDSLLKNKVFRHSRQAMANHRGFTLIELLVMIAIAGIIISMVTLSVGSGSRADQMKAESERLFGMMQLSLEEAVLTSKPIGLKLIENFEQGVPQFQYEWSSLENGQWVQIEGDALFSSGKFMQSLDVDLQIQGLPLSLQESTKQEADGSDNEPEDKLKKYQPDIFFLHSGELSPAFTLVISAEGLTEEYQIEGNEIGQLQLRTPNEEDEIQ